MKTKRHCWSGWSRLDPEGVECRIGALWTRLFLRDKWALTAFRKVWMKNPLTWRAYCRDPWWRAHERHHLFQLDHSFGGSHLRYLYTFGWQYFRYRSHDKAPLECEANRAADNFIRSMQPGDEEAGSEP